MTSTAVLQLGVLAAQLALLLVLLRVIRQYRLTTSDESGLYARVRTLEQHDPQGSPWRDAWHLYSPIPIYGPHRPRHLKETT